MTDTLAPVERTNWASSAWNSTLDRNDVPSAWLYGQDHLWATGHLVSSPASFGLSPRYIYIPLDLSNNMVNFITNIIIAIHNP